MTVDELRDLRELIGDLRAMGWDIRLGKTRRLILRRPRGGMRGLADLLHLYRAEIKAILDDEAVIARERSRSGPADAPRVVWISDHWEVRRPESGPAEGTP